jgi:hypothetical protein
MAGQERAFRASFAVCAAAALVPLWSVKYLPMVDLPQHAAQVSIWQHLHDPDFGFAGRFEVHLATPYLATYALVRALAAVVPLRVALQLVVSLAVVGLPLSLLAFFRRKSVSAWWSLLGFPLAFGYAFRWGFLPFVVGLPLGFLYLALAGQHARAPSVRRALGLGALSLLLFSVHGLLGVCCPLLAAGGMVASPERGRWALRLAPLGAALPWMIAWRLLDPPPSQIPTIWALGGYRFAELFALVAYHSRAVVPAFVLIAAAVIGLRRVGAAGERWRTELPPLVLAVAAALLLPERTFGGTAFLPLRFTVFWLPFLITWLQPGAPRWTRGVLVAGMVALSAVLLSSFRRFDAEARQYAAVAALLPARPVLRPVIFQETPDDRDFLQFPVWTQADSGGLAGFSFAANINHVAMLARYRAPAPDLMSRDDEWHPERFDWRREIGKGYDAYVVFSAADRTRELFTGAPVELVARSGRWWLYRPSPRR